MGEQAAARFAAGYGRAAAVYADVLDPTLEGVARRIVELAQVAAMSVFWTSRREPGRRRARLRGEERA